MQQHDEAVFGEELREAFEAVLLHAGVSVRNLDRGIAPLAVFRDVQGAAKLDPSVAVEFRLVSRDHRSFLRLRGGRRAVVDELVVHPSSITTWSMKHQLQSSPDSSEVMIGCCVARKCFVACLFFESSQHPT